MHNSGSYTVRLFLFDFVVHSNPKIILCVSEIPAEVQDSDSEHTGESLKRVS
jgi:hypothetical protein